MSVEERWNHHTAKKDLIRETSPRRRREENEATPEPLRHWCAHYMMGRDRTHHHVTKQKNDAHDLHGLRFPDANLSFTFSHNSKMISNVRCGERRHHTIMVSVVKSRR